MHEINPGNVEESTEEIPIPEFLVGFGPEEQEILDHIDAIVIQNIRLNMPIYVPELDAMQKKVHEIHNRQRVMTYSQRLEMDNWHS